jgi:hypothetical protein
LTYEEYIALELAHRTASVELEKHVRGWRVWVYLRAVFGVLLAVLDRLFPPTLTRRRRRRRVIGRERLFKPELRRRNTAPPGVPAQVRRYLRAALRPLEHMRWRELVPLPA